MLYVFRQCLKKRGMEEISLVYWAELGYEYVEIECNEIYAYGVQNDWLYSRPIC
jgi:hypothetical protein